MRCKYMFGVCAPIHLPFLMIVCVCVWTLHCSRSQLCGDGRRKEERNNTPNDKRQYYVDISYYYPFVLNREQTIRRQHHKIT